MAQKEYLKMADVFGDASQEYIEQLLYSGFMSKDSCELIAHAVSSHDELVAEVERLRDTLSECYPYVKDVADWGNSYDKDLKNRVFDSCGIK